MKSHFKICLKNSSTIRYSLSCKSLWHLFSICFSNLSAVRVNIILARIIPCAFSQIPLQQAVLEGSFLFLVETQGHDHKNLLPVKENYKDNLHAVS